MHEHDLVDISLTSPTRWLEGLPMHQRKTYQNRTSGPLFNTQPVTEQIHNFTTPAESVPANQDILSRTATSLIQHDQQDVSMITRPPPRKTATTQETAPILNQQIANIIQMLSNEVTGEQQEPDNAQPISILQAENQLLTTQQNETTEINQHLYFEATNIQREPDNAQQQIMLLQTENQLLTTQQNETAELNQQLYFEALNIQHERDNAQQQISLLQTQNQKLKSQLDKAIQNKQNTSHEMQQKLNNTQQEVTQLKNREKQQKKELANQRTQTQLELQKTEDARNQANQAYKQAKIQKTSLKKAVNKIQKLRRKNAHQQTTFQDKAARTALYINRKITIKRNQLKTAQQQTKKLLTTNQKQKAELRELRNLAEHQTNQIKAQQTQLNSNTENVNRLNQEATIKQKELKKAYLDLNKHKRKKGKLSKANKNLTSLKIQAELRAKTAQDHSSQLKLQVEEQETSLDNEKKEKKKWLNIAKDNERKLHEAQQQIKSLQDTTQQQVIDINELAIQVKMEKEDKKHLEKEVAQLESFINQLNIQIKETTTETQRLNKDITIERQELDKAQQQTKKLMTKNQQQETKLDELMISNYKQNEDLKELRTQAQQTEQQITDFKNQADQMRNQIKGQKIRLNNTVINTQFLTNKITTKQQELATTQHQVMELKAEQDKTAQKVYQLTQNTQAQEHELENQRDKILQLQLKSQQQDQQLKFQHFSYQRISQRTIATNNEAITLRSTLRTQKLEVIEAHKEAERLGTQLQKAQTHLKNANQAAQKLEQDMSQLKRRNQQHHRANQTKNQTIVKQNKGITQLRRKFRKRNAELDTMTANAKRQKISCQKLQSYVKSQAIAADEQIENGQINLKNANQVILTLQHETSRLNQQMTAKQLELDNAKRRAEQQDDKIQELQAQLDKTALTSKQFIEDAKVKGQQLDSSYQRISKMNTENLTQKNEQNILRTRTIHAELQAKTAQTKLQQLQSSNDKLTIELDRLKRQKEQCETTNVTDSSKATPYASFLLKVQPNSKNLSIDINLNKLTKGQAANITAEIPSLELKVTNIIYPSNIIPDTQMLNKRQRVKPYDDRTQQNVITMQRPIAVKNNHTTGSNTELTPTIEKQLANRNKNGSPSEAAPAAAKPPLTRKSCKNTTSQTRKELNESIVLKAQNALKNITPNTSQPIKNLSEVSNMPPKERKIFYNSISDKEIVLAIRNGCDIYLNRIRSQKHRNKKNIEICNLKKISNDLMEKQSTS